MNYRWFNDDCFFMGELYLRYIKQHLSNKWYSGKPQHVLEKVKKLIHRPQNVPMTDSISQYGGFGNRAVIIWQGYGYVETLIRQVCISQMDTHTHTTDGLTGTHVALERTNLLSRKKILLKRPVWLTDVLLYLKE